MTKVDEENGLIFKTRTIKKKVQQSNITDRRYDSYREDIPYVVKKKSVLNVAMLTQACLHAIMTLIIPYHVF